MDNNTEMKNTVTPEAENNPAGNPRKTRKNRRIIKSGSYTVAVSAVVIAIVIVINFLFSALPESYTEIDISKESLYTVGDTTKDIVGGLEENVTLYYICEEGKEEVQVEKMVNSYAELSDKLTVTKIDPGVNPNFVPQYTSEDVKSNSIIAVSDKRTTVAAYNDFYRYNVDGYAEMSYEEFNEFYYSYYYQYQSVPEYSMLFYGEQAITSAVSYVVADDIPSLYYTTGHGETELSSTYAGYVTTENYNYESLSLLTSDIPDDAEAILIIAPTMDFTSDETDALTKYVSGGGDVILITDYQSYSSESHPNLASFCTSLGMESADGLVMEGDPNHYLRLKNRVERPDYIVPIIGSTAESSPASCLESTNMHTLMPGSHGIVAAEDNEDWTVTPVLSTTDEAYLKTVIDDSFTFSKQDSDIEGQYLLGAASSRTDGEGGRFVWYSSSALIDESTDSNVGKGNSQMFIATLNWMAGKTETISIIGKDVSVDPLTMTESTVSAWKTVLCVIVPAAVAVTGLVVWARRRRR